jgi:N-acetylglucosamine-6-sulfatase
LNQNLRVVGSALAAALLMGACASAPPRPASPAATPPPAATAPLAATTTAPTIRPNIIFILTDDQDVRAMSFMPRTLELLGRAGSSFTQAYVSSPLCAPSRASILTGRYPHNTGVLSNDEPDGGFGVFYRSGDESKTVAMRLHDQGYRTALIGKYMNDYPRRATGEYVPPGWDEWDATTSDAAYFDFLMNRNGVQQYYNGPENYSTDVIRDVSLDFVKKMHDAPQRAPYFLYISTIAPHFPATVAPRHQGQFPQIQAPRVPSFNEPDIADKPAWVRERAPLGEDAIRQLDKLYKHRLQTMLAVDELVDKLLETLAATGELAHTYVFFTSDNGFQQGEHRFGKGKGVSYDESVHVPLLVRGPGVPAGGTFDHLVSNVDLLPTWLELAGARVPAGVDGRSFAPLLRPNAPPAAQWRKDVLVEFLEADSDEAPRFTSLRTLRWGYTEYDRGDRELYDIRADPYELDNRAATAPDVVSSLAQRLEALRHCTGASCN